MRLQLYQVDAFAEKLFTGNPAAVCPLEEWLPEAVMQSIALENNLSETAFVVREASGWRIRWFTPGSEVDLCGHATLATAWVLFDLGLVDGSELFLQSRSGKLKVSRDDGLLTLDFPALQVSPCLLPDSLVAALGRRPAELYRAMDYMAVFDTEEEILSLEPDFNALGRIDLRGLIVTAPGKEADFVSRFFAPRVGVNEDPVTGSAHCMLTPFWAARLGRNRLQARQLSRRGGSLVCELRGDRVLISGRCVPYLKGTIDI